MTLHLPFNFFSALAVVLMIVSGVTHAQSSYTVIIDPQYGGKDWGPVSAFGTLGKDISLKIAQKLAHKLTAEGPYKVILTREGDTHVSLEERTAIANRESGNVFISIGLNGFNDKRANGLETYFLRMSTESSKVGSSQNSRNADLKFILADLTFQKKYEDSGRLAVSIHTPLVTATGLKDRGIKSGLYYVLVGTRMPSIMVMLGFLTNPRDGKLLRNDFFQDKVIDALSGGVLKFLEGTKLKNNH